MSLDLVSTNPENPRMKIASSFFAALGAMHMTCLFVCMFVLGNCASVASMIFIRPLSPTIHERIIAYFTEVLFGSIVNWSEAIGGLEVIVTGDKIPGSAIVMSNHVSFTDSVAIHCVARE
jgi:hypothetical protein